MEAYHSVVREVLARGSRKPNRTGVDTLSAFNINYTVDLSLGFPLLTTKAISWKNIVAENLWFLSGQRDTSMLKRHRCKFWDPWTDDDGKVPSAYGHFWRHFPAPEGAPFVDQVRTVLDQLRRNPSSRRLVISAWAPHNALHSALPPCHLLWILNVQYDGEARPCLNLHLTQRSADVALGVPYNIAGYAFLLSLFARFVDMRPGIFAHTLVDAHIYTSKPDGSMADYDHVPGLKTQLERTPRPLPRLEIDPGIRDLDDVEALYDADTETLLNTFRLEGYDPHPGLKFKVAV